MTFDSSNRIDRRLNVVLVIHIQVKSLVVRQMNRNIGSIWHNEDLYYRY